MKTKESLKIIGLKVNGFRKLTAVEMEFAEAGLTQIKGKNRQGKTSALDVVEWLIKGNKMLNKDIIQHGKEKATAQLTLGDYTITRTTTLKTQRLEVRNTKTDTVLTGEVQNFLATLINELTFDSRSFLDKTPLEQLRFCMELFGIDFTEIDKELLSLETDRTITGREIKKFGDLDESKPEKVERADVDSLIKKRRAVETENEQLRYGYQLSKDVAIKEIESFNREQRAIRNKLQEANQIFSELQRSEIAHQEEITQLEIRLESKKKSLRETQVAIKCQSAILKAMPQPEPEKPLVANIPLPAITGTDDIDAKIQNAMATNQKAELYEQWLAKKKEKLEKDSEYSTYTIKIDALRKKKIEILTSIDTGVKGFEIREDGLYYKGIYSENWSDMESIRIASELCLAQDPTLKALFIDRFESFDKTNRAEFDKWAKEHGVQVIVTIVDDIIPETITEDNVFYIEDGLIVAPKPSDGKATRKQVEELEK